jgi:metal-dependent amidase/aminoacylase/carboxypeptidase family protein
VRTLSEDARSKVGGMIERRLKGIATASGCQLDFKWLEGYPPTVNDPAMYDYVAAVARRTFGSERFLPVGKPSMGGEDFAYYLQKVPGCFFLIGVEPSAAETYPPLHSDRYDFTDAALTVGMRMFLELVLNWGR